MVMRVKNNDIKLCPRLKEKPIIVTDGAPGRGFLLLECHSARELSPVPIPDMTGPLSVPAYSCPPLASDGAVSPVGQRPSVLCCDTGPESQVAPWEEGGEA